MLRLAVVLTLVAVCFAQTPTRPNITETFTSTVSRDGIACMIFVVHIQLSQLSSNYCVNFVLRFFTQGGAEFHDNRGTFFGECKHFYW